MTTTPNPTAAELAAALSNARGAVADEGRPGLSPSTVRDARVLLHIKAQLAESERARAALDKRLKLLQLAVSLRTEEEHWCHAAMVEDAKLEDAAADQTAARESAENTAEETMTEAEVARDCGNKNHDDGVIRNGKCSACGCQLLKLIGPEEPAPAQTPEPVEPSDDALWRIACGPDDAPNSTIDARRALYRAGLAAEAAAHAETRKRLSQETDRAAGLHSAFKDASAELERVRAELQKAEEGRRYSNGWLSYLAERCGLDVLRTVTSEDLVKGVVAELTTLRAQARARRVPSRDDLMYLIYGAIPFGSYSKTDANELADAVLRLFAEADGSPAQPEPLVTSDHEPPVPLPEVLPDNSRNVEGGDVSGGDRWLERSLSSLKSETSNWPAWKRAAADSEPMLAIPGAQQRAAEPTPWKPTAGERAVLVASPDPSDEHLIGSVVKIEDTFATANPSSHWLVEDDSPDSWEFLVHRDATWRPASAAPATLIDHKGSINEAEAKPAEPDSAWLKRTVEELTTARPVEVAAWERAAALNGLSATAAGFEPLLVGAGTIRDRNVGHVSEGLRNLGWPLRRNAKPAEPSPQPGGELDAVNAKLREHSERIEAGVDALKDTENALTRRVEALEAQTRALRRFALEDYPYGPAGEGPEGALDRIEREERSKK